MSEKKLLVTQTRSALGRERSQLKTLKSLGLGRIGKTAVHSRQPSVIGMLRKVSHLIEIEHVSSGSKSK